MNYYSTKKKKVNLFEIPSIRLVLRLLLVILLFSVSRWLIYLFNTEFFHHLDLLQALYLYFLGMRFDLVVIAFVNIPVILYFCFPSKAIYNKLLQGIFNLYFIIANAVIVVLNMIDVLYFRFVGKRMTSAFFQSLDGSDDNILPVMGQVVVDYWYILVLTILFVLVLIVVTKRTHLVHSQSVNNSRWYFTQWISLMVFAVLTVVACRGGVQAKPINPTIASKYTDSQNVPIILNAPFNIVKNPAQQVLEEVHYFEPEEMAFSPIHYDLAPNRFVSDSLGFQPNLVYIVLESFGQEMITYYNPDRRYQLTPFLDSLLDNSLTFNGFANGRRSVEALPSLFSGLPSLMDADFSSSAYLDNRIDGLGLNLKTSGYHTSMFHGGNNGTKGFDVYARNAGFDLYFGRDEYGNDDDFDGRLGIFDGPFLQYCLQNINNFPKPFATCIYTLSSHHPYKLPRHFEMPRESYPWSGFEKTVYYADCALRDFFNEASKQPWFDSTLFVITADHANAEHFQPEYSNIWGMYSIPIAFYMPSQIEPRRTNELAQQTDLNLSILSALGVNDTVFSFGRNVFDSLSEPNAIAYINQTYQYSNGVYLVQSDGDHTFGVFNIQRDRMLNNNLIDHIQCSDLAKMMKERIQEYNNRFIHNQLYIDKEALHEQAEDTIHHQSDLWQETQDEPAQPD